MKRLALRLVVDNENFNNRQAILNTATDNGKLMLSVLLY